MDEARMQIARLSPAKSELATIFRRICAIAADTTLVERVGIWLYVRDHTAIRCACLYERSKQLFSEGTTLQVADFPEYFAQLAARKTIPAESAAIDPRTSELHETYLAPLGITSMLDAAIRLNEELLGVVCHEHVGPPREWTTEERDFAGSVADLVALKIKGAELHKLRSLLHDRDTDRDALRHRDGLARMAAGVAHDFRNILTVILGGAEQIALRATDSSESAQLAQEIIQAAGRGSALTTQLMTLGRLTGGHPQVIDVRETITRFLPVLQKSAGGRHAVVLHAETGLGRVFIDPNHLDRVLLNLVLNARDAMRDGGEIHVRISSPPGVRPGDSPGQIILAVEDSGGGIDPAVADRMFEPFVTTKSRDRGTGLGLAIVREIVDHAGGSLHVENRPGAGATFRVVLPRVAGG